uniref:RING-type domain-containing protein n=1 Tax=Setaria italica TaxID=4555 RepID=K3YBZ3_SETIT
MQLWEHHQYNHAAAYDDTFGQELITTPDGTAETGEAAGSGGDNGPALYDDDHDMTAGEATPARFTDGGFGGVPASTAAIAGLKKQRHDGSSGADNMCVICMRHYKKGKRLYVMPCAFKHRFHRKCLKKWLSRSHLCPLCRHALPTEDRG